MPRFHRLGLWLGLAAFLAAPGRAAEPADQLRPWSDYRVILWVGDSIWQHPDRLPRFLERLRELGIDTGMVHGAGADPQPFVTNRFPYYVENIVNRGLCLKWNSRVTDWDAFVTEWAKNGRPERAFVREYCLEDPGWRAWAAEQMRATARRHAAFAPLAYNIRDELSLTISANPFDYDYSPASLAGFRAWLQARYPDLAQLNRAWETRFDSWPQVQPFSTDQIKHRMASGQAWPPAAPDWAAVQRLRFDPATARRELTRWNLAPWADFRTYMDIVLARTLDELRWSARAIDPATPVGIEGTQMPHAFGGHDLWRLARVLDWVEPYDIGNAREIFGSFMPGRPVLSTVFETETAAARRRLWHLLLEGDRGCLIWWSEDCFDWQDPELTPTAKARALAPVFTEMKSPLARLFLRAKREYDPIALVYSQPSIQVDWLIESTGDGSTWPRRFSSFEAEHNRMARARNAWLKALQDLGFSPRFVPAEQLAQPNGLSGIETLVLPTTRALSEAEAQSVARFLGADSRAGTHPRVVLCDGTPGEFDAHGRLRMTNEWLGFFPAARAGERSYAASGVSPAVPRSQAGDVAEYARRRLATPPDLGWAKWISSMLNAMTPSVRVPLETRTRIHRYQLGRAQLVAFERGIDYQMSEDLRQAGGNQALEQPVEIEASLAQAAHIYDLRAGRYLGHRQRFGFTLQPWQPSLFALLPERAATENVIADLLTRAE